MTPAERHALERSVAGAHAKASRRVAALQRDFGAIVESAAGASVDDEHDPEGQTIAFERAQVSALLEHARAQLAALERASDDLGRDDYGSCDVCGDQITVERLLARPTARTCVGCAR